MAYEAHGHNGQAAADQVPEVVLEEFMRTFHIVRNLQDVTIRYGIPPVILKAGATWSVDIIILGHVRVCRIGGRVASRIEGGPRDAHEDSQKA